MYFANTFCTGSLDLAHLRRGMSQRCAAIIFVISASNSTRISVMFPDFEEKIVHAIFHVNVGRRLSKKFFILGSQKLARIKFQIHI